MMWKSGIVFRLAPPLTDAAAGLTVLVELQVA